MKKDKAWLKEALMGLTFRVSEIGKVRLREVFELVDQLDEPTKPVIPQFVADWIESQDDPIYEMCVNYEMWGVNGDDGTTSFTREIAEWFDDNLNVENYYRACIDGYEVEKEKRYQVKIPVTVWDGDASELKEHTSFLAYDITSGETRILSTTRCRGDYRTDLTESEIKAIDKRYWAFAEELEE